MNTSTNSPIQQWIEASEPTEPKVLLDYFDSLAEISCDSLWGKWNGSILPSGHPGEKQLAGLNWVGKEFITENKVHPILVSGAIGEVEVSDMLGQACVRDVRYRGKVSAAMIYDTHPTYDYFRAIEPDLILGVMDRKDDNASLFFCLQRQN